LVSHDRRFVSKLVNRVWEVDGGHFREYEGDWSFYWRKRRERAAADAGEQTAAAASERESKAAQEASVPTSERFAGRSLWQLRQDLERLEERIATVEAELASVGRELATVGEELAKVDEGPIGVRAKPSAARPELEIIAGLGERHAALDAELLALMEEWHELTDLVGA